MYQSGSISTPGTCTQGKLLQYVRGFDTDLSVLPQQQRVVTQCGVPSVVQALDGGLDLFVAGQADHPNSPSCAPWPLSPLCLHLSPQSRDLELTRLPAIVHGIQRFVSGIPSAVTHDRTTLVYFNGGQLLEYRRTADSGWRACPIPVPNVVADADPVATIAGDSVFVISAPGGESLLLCSRDLQTSDWRFVDLGAEASICSVAGDPAIAAFRGQWHVLVCAAAAGQVAGVCDAFELWDFQLAPDGSVLEAYSISAVVGFRDGAVPVKVIGTPSIVASHHKLQVFVRSEAGRLIEFRSHDGQQWESLPVSRGRVGGNAGAILLDGENAVVFASDSTGCLIEYREIGGLWQGRNVSRIGGEAERWPRPVAQGQQLHIFDLDVAV